MIMPKENKKAPIIGFALMLAGPGILILAGFFTEIFGYVSKTAADAIMWAAIIIPGIGAVLSVFSLVLWKKTGNLGRALSIVTVIMCNPIFYFVYLLICGVASRTLADLAWM